jgi:hypothetical protein
MTQEEEDAVVDAIHAEVRDRYKDATADDLATLGMMLQDFNAEAAKRIPGWSNFEIKVTNEGTPQ